MRIACFNVENLFSRARVMNLDTWADGKKVLTEYGKLTALLQKPVYSPADKTKIVESLKKIGLGASNESTFVILRENHGRLVKRPASGLVVEANGRGDWIGWLELKKQAVNDVAVQMTGKVVQELNADILAVIEAEDRIALGHFNDQLLKPLNANLRSIMLIDGNDDRGIDVGLLTKPGFDIESIVSHVDDMDNDSRIFSRDCPEFTVRIDDNTTMVVMVNHFKSKGYGSAAASNARRKLQAKRARELYELRRAQGIERIAVVGDFNDTPDSDPLSPLLGSGSDLKDIFDHSQFLSDGRPGTYANGTASNKIDYILLSPVLWNSVEACGVLRKGVWGGKHGTIFPHYDEMTKAIHAASDHAALWVDLNLT